MDANMPSSSHQAGVKFVACFQFHEESKVSNVKFLVKVTAVNLASSYNLSIQDGIDITARLQLLSGKLLICECLQICLQTCLAVAVWLSKLLKWQTHTAFKQNRFVWNQIKATEWPPRSHWLLLAVKLHFPWLRTHQSQTDRRPKHRW